MVGEEAAAGLPLGLPDPDPEFPPAAPEGEEEDPPPPTTPLPPPPVEEGLPLGEVEVTNELDPPTAPLDAPGIAPLDEPPPTTAELEPPPPTTAEELAAGEGMALLDPGPGGITAPELLGPGVGVGVGTTPTLLEPGIAGVEGVAGGDKIGTDEEEEEDGGETGGTLLAAGVDRIGMEEEEPVSVGADRTAGE